MDCLYPQTEAFLAPYCVSGDGETEGDRDIGSEQNGSESEPIRVKVLPEELTREQNTSDRAHDRDGSPRVTWPPEYLERLAVYRQIAEAMPERGIVLMHGSVIAVDDEAYLFTAISGTGKSTHTKRWRELFGDRAQMINDDKPLIRIEKDRVLACGTPWDGKHHLSTNKCVPLKAICFLNRGEKNEIHPIDPMEKYPTLVQQTYRPSDPVALGQTMKLIDLLMRSVSFYDLYCNMDIEAAKVAFAGMNQKEEPGTDE